MVNREGPDGPGRARFHEALFHQEIDLLAGYCRHFAQAHGMIAPDPRETARMFAAGLTQIRREHFAAAPDMLAALKDAAQTFEAIGKVARGRKTVIDLCKPA